MNDLIKLSLAPMAGYTDLPFRLLAQENGADETTSEMVSAKGLYYGDRKSADLLKTVPEELNYGIQIFGSEPDILKEAASIIEEKRDLGEIDYKFIDFNVGCPAPKIVKNGDGSALLNNLNLLSENIKAIKDSIDVPLSVKTRVGFNSDNIVEISKAIEDSGADKITIHPRTRDQFYSGISDWKAAQRALDNLTIPTVLSGDITSPERAKEAFNLGFKELMIGRAAIENPYIFTQIKDFFKTGSYESTSVLKRRDLALRHLELVNVYNLNDHAIIAMRKHLASYVKGAKNATELRKKIFTISDINEMIDLFKNVEELEI